jgi:hypothetical protein
VCLSEGQYRFSCVVIAELRCRPLETILAAKYITKGVPDRIVRGQLQSKGMNRA